ncbi:hypothetical protein [Gordonia sp. NPDC003429]
MWMTVTFTVLLAVLAVAMIMQFRGRRIGGMKGTGAGYAQGTLTVTGVSERPEPDSKGQAFCTVSGTIVGPGTNPTEVYGQLVLDEGQPWPQIGSDQPVVYKPGKASTTWQFGQLPPPPVAEPPATPPPPAA